MEALFRLIEDGLSGERHKEGLIGVFQTEGTSLANMLEDILGNKLDSYHCLFTGWLYLRFWKEKTKFAFISELKGKCMFDA